MIWLVIEKMAEIFLKKIKIGLKRKKLLIEDRVSVKYCFFFNYFQTFSIKDSFNSGNLNKS
jgi:hypothetical protein